MKSQLPALRAPLRDHLKDPVELAAKGRIADRLFAAGDHGRARLMPGVRTAWLACALACGCVLVLFIQKDPRGSTGPLLTEAGTHFRFLDASQGGQVRLADGSSLQVDQGGKVVALASTEREFALRLDRGRLDVAVTPGGPRKWSVETKIARVEVVGTVFSVTRDERHVKVQVERGTVVVRSPYLAEGARRLEAGQRLDIAPENDMAPDQEQSRTAAEPARIHAVELVDLDSQEEAEAEAGMTAQPEVAVARSSYASLLAEAEAARARGDLNLSEAKYKKLVDRYGQERNVALALYTLGTLQIALQRLPQAYQSFERALASQPSSSLEEDLLLRLVELDRTRGRHNSARILAGRYLGSFPAGRHRTLMQEITRMPADFPEVPGE